MFFFTFQVICNRLTELKIPLATSGIPLAVSGNTLMVNVNIPFAIYFLSVYKYNIRNVFWNLFDAFKLELKFQNQ